MGSSARFFIKSDSLEKSLKSWKLNSSSALHLLAIRNYLLRVIRMLQKKHHHCEMNALKARGNPSILVCLILMEVIL